MLSVANKPNMLSVVMLNVVMLNVIMLNVVMLNVVMLNAVMLNAVMLNVIMLSVVVPANYGCQKFYGISPSSKCQSYQSISTIEQKTKEWKLCFLFRYLRAAF